MRRKFSRKICSKLMMVFSLEKMLPAFIALMTIRQWWSSWCDDSNIIFDDCLSVFADTPNLYISVTLVTFNQSTSYYFEQISKKKKKKKIKKLIKTFIFSQLFLKYILKVSFCVKNILGCYYLLCVYVCALIKSIIFKKFK